MSMHFSVPYFVVGDIRDIYYAELVRLDSKPVTVFHMQNGDVIEVVGDHQVTYVEALTKSRQG